MPYAHSLSRRSLLKLAVFHALAIPVPVTLRSKKLFAAERADAAEHALLQMVSGLYPLDGLSESVYERVARTIEDDIASSPEKTELVEQGLAELETSASDGNWDQLDQEQREKILETLQSGEFFGYVKNQVIHLLFSDPEVWELIGYGGSSIEHGGYINRGFDDIDWLPEAS
jgi:hypothetical protein